MRALSANRVNAWFATSTPGENRIWIPFAKADLLLVMGLLGRLSRTVGLQKDDLILAVAPDAPRIANALPYFWMFSDKLETGLGLEFIVGSMFNFHRSNWPAFALQKQPTVLLARPSDALSMVDMLALAAGKPKAKPRDLFHRLRTGIFFGEPLAPDRTSLEEAYGLEAFDFYLSAEFPGLFAECSAHAGLHVWMDTCIPEIISKEELTREASLRGGVPRAAFLDETAPGTEGELVLTTFGEALPLVRYRTCDLVGVVGHEPCPCGITHPRIRVLGKRDRSE